MREIQQNGEIKNVFDLLYQINKSENGKEILSYKIEQFYIFTNRREFNKDLTFGEFLLKINNKSKYDILLGSVNFNGNNGINALISIKKSIENKLKEKSSEVVSDEAGEIGEELRDTASTALETKNKIKFSEEEEDTLKILSEFSNLDINEIKKQLNENKKFYFEPESNISVEIIINKNNKKVIVTNKKSKYTDFASIGHLCQTNETKRTIEISLGKHENKSLSDKAGEIGEELRDTASTALETENKIKFSEEEEDTLKIISEFSYSNKNEIKKELSENETYYFESKKEGVFIEVNIYENDEKYVKILDRRSEDCAIILQKYLNQTNEIQEIINEFLFEKYTFSKEERVSIQYLLKKYPTNLEVVNYDLNNDNTFNLEGSFPEGITSVSIGLVPAKNNNGELVDKKKFQSQITIINNGKNPTKINLSETDEIKEIFENKSDKSISGQSGETGEKLRNTGSPALEVKNEIEFSEKEKISIKLLSEKYSVKIDFKQDIIVLEKKALLKDDNALDKMVIVYIDTKNKKLTISKKINTDVIKIISLSEDDEIIEFIKTGKINNFQTLKGEVGISPLFANKNK